ncbi:MAG TPA: hypothetical protein VJ961_09560 [Mariprofundaceae bacterium]|nr:hypothetical protein [Mariprofundaceae bacterium]
MQNDATDASLIGLAPLTRMVFAGRDLTPVQAALQTRLEQNPQDANAWMDLSTILQLHFERDAGLAMQAEALKLQQLYHLPTKQDDAIRMLVLKTPGELMDNAPIEFLLEQSDITIDQLYLSPDLSELPPLPEHDLLYVAIGQSERNASLLQRLETWLAKWPRPVVNRPARIAATARDSLHELLQGAPGVVTPAIRVVGRHDLAEIACEAVPLTSLLPDTAFPVIVRPVDSQAGQDLERIDTAAGLAAYLGRTPAETFYLADYVDYSSPDGLFRKYRIVLVGDRPFPGHMAISNHWIIHYLNAGMQESAGKRREEETFMRGFDHDFAARHADALRAIAERTGLDYLVIDCAETRTGELLVFEADAGAIVHDMDPVDLFPYKPAHMHRLFDAFRTMLADRAHAD